MTSTANVGDLVVPGTTIGDNNSSELGRGITRVDERCVATVVGILSNSDGVLHIEQRTDPIREVEVGDIVIGEVNRINPKTAEIKILHVEGKPPRSLPQSHLFADLFVAKIVDRFLPSPGDAMRKRDIVRAKIEQLEPMLRAECRSSANLGVLHAICPACGESLQSSSEVDDVNVACARCDYVGFRALSDGFGHGFEAGEAGVLSALNRDGERWSNAAQAFVSKDGERPYLSPLSDHRRGDHHEKSKEVEKFLGSLQQGGGRGGGRGGGGRGGGGRGGRPARKMYEAPCTMCGTKASLPFEPTPGAPARCSPCKEKVDDGKATQDELAKERENLSAAREKAHLTAGMKLFIGGVAFAATEDDLRTLFSAEGELKDVHIATDRETGKSRGFAFITFSDRKQGAAAIEKLNGTDLQGRRLSVQESKPRGGGGGRGGGGRGGGGRGGGGRGGGGRRDRR